VVIAHSVRIHYPEPEDREEKLVGEWIPVGLAEGDAPPGEMRAFPLGGDRVVALARLEDGSWVAFDDTCTHEECPLSKGDLEGDRVVCYCHGSEFDVHTGSVLGGPADEPIGVYELRVVDGKLELRVEGDLP
jgi:3-phenylpropionate/trans-cinnamate dioxygenase ferredoxin component